MLPSYNNLGIAHAIACPTSFPGSLSPRPEEPLLSLLGAGRERPWERGCCLSPPLQNIGTLSVQELFFHLIGLLGVRPGVSPVGMVELFVHGASLTT